MAVIVSQEINKMLRNFILFGMCIAFIMLESESMPQNDIAENVQDTHDLDPIYLEDVRNAYYDLMRQDLNFFPNTDRAQMIVAQYKPPFYPRLFNWNSPNDNLHISEQKRTSRFRQCYFNPISCFKK